MNDMVREWLLEDKNPAIKFRTQSELLGQSVASADVKNWIFEKLPTNWFDVKGLWYIYYITALAECGLSVNDFPCEYLSRGIEKIETDFQFGCADFMLLRAMVKLGLCEHKSVKRVISGFAENVLPDGGFLCNNRLRKFSYTPKSCYKANIHMLMFLAECRKKHVELCFGQSIVDYFLNRDIFYSSSDRTKVIIDSAKETFYPFEPMRVGLHNIVESFSALGYGNDERLQEAWYTLDTFKDEQGRIILSRTLTKSYLPKEKLGVASKWATFYYLLAEKNRNIII